MSGDQQMLRDALADMAEEIGPLNLLDRVNADVARQRRRRRVWVGGGILAAAAATVVGVIALAPDDRAAQPADEGTPVEVVLDAAAADVVGQPTTAVLDENDVTWVLDDDGRQHALRVDTSIPDPGGIALSRGGRFLATGGVVPGGWLISVVDTHEAQRGSGEVRNVAPEVPPEGVRDFTPAISPDGALVAMATPSSHGGPVVVQILRVDGTQSARLPLDDRWRAAGERVGVAFTGDGLHLAVFTGSDVGVLDVTEALDNGTSGTSPAFVPTEYVSANGLAVSPDGRQIAVANAATDDGRRTWAVLDAARAELVRELERPADDLLLAWQAEGSMVWWQPANPSDPAAVLWVGDQPRLTLTAANGIRAVARSPF